MGALVKVPSTPKLAVVAHVSNHSTREEDRQIFGVFLPACVAEIASYIERHSIDLCPSYTYTHTCATTHMNI